MTHYEKTRIKSGFLLFPKCIEDKWKWLVFATWEDKLVEGFGVRWPVYWESTKWIE